MHKICKELKLGSVRRGSLNKKSPGIWEEIDWKIRERNHLRQIKGGKDKK